MNKFIEMINIYKINNYCNYITITTIITNSKFFNESINTSNNKKIKNLS